MKLTPDSLQARVVDFGVAACQELRRMPKDVVHSHIAKQLVRSATSPAANYAEARASESPRDFVHKMQVCLKELRETAVWLDFVQKLGRGSAEPRVSSECQELIAIFATSVKTARSKAATTTPNGSCHRCGAAQ